MRRVSTTDAAITEPLMLPDVKVLRWMHDVGFAFALQPYRLAGATCHTQAAADAQVMIDTGNVIIQGDSTDLTAINAAAASSTTLRFHDCVIVRTRD